MKSPEWSLIQYTHPESNGAIALGISASESVRQLPNDWPDSAMELFAAWDRWEPQLRTLDIASLPVLPDASLVAPLIYPKKVICAGVNYYDHAEEMGTSRPDPSESPFFFLKTPTNTIVGTGTDIVIPGSTAPNVDWEAELGIVIGRRASGLTVEEARSHIAGYVVSNDISARGMFARPNPVFPAFAFDWVAHKSQDGFCPIGPGIVPAFRVEDPEALDIRLSVNGVVKQDSNTKQLVTGVDALVAAASQLMTLEPGDLILTGTPAGVGMPRQDFLKAGDVVVVEIDGIGRLENRMVAK